MPKQKSLSQIRTFVERVSAKQGWVPNPDEEFRRKIEEGLQTNYNRYGFFLCPCRDGDGDRQHDRDITCPCSYNLADQAEYGHCYCGLFLSLEFAATGKKTEAIPERRPDELWD
ncbi:ferredoxin-thioredoxin reductase catalytic domain-containing protein [Spirochaeta lutea]|uniref:ferredoxin:thioredoxin reductase n=1 Tax=Spirochaeta lutea TaxID=1480694 RepID=A0A098QV46_9SPIO|nr:ferredoxin-thioredoxin reductase catalytic domain-containing protein [Spirochaeta lutea]KGE71725.1 ferredoxin thioredoxin reductase [Spirochaeta lutea]